VAAKANVLEDNFKFLRGVISRPKTVGAIIPSSPALARAIAAQVELDENSKVIELGPGTGVVTEALIERGLPQEKLTMVEYDLEFAQHMAARYPRSRVINGDAFHLRRTLGAADGSQDGTFTAIVSGLPLLNFPPDMRAALIDDVLTLLKPGAPFIQFSYGLHSPAVPPRNFTVTRAGIVWMNIPPARIWVYRRA
jgi:phosphatidylethanolamine/phosphatidyl-N-methylethanolamine N-methyltransferase